MEELILGEKDAADWVYRGEGAANLVLAYTGSSPTFIGKVMRIQKAPRKGKKGVIGDGEFTAEEELLWREIKDLTSSSTREIVQDFYVNHIMRPLLGPKHIDAGVRVPAAKGFLLSVEKNVTRVCLAWRVEAACVDMCRDSVQLMSDHSVFLNDALESGTCLCVEIKPKCGFLPLSKFISEGNAVKRSVSRFEMHQALKLHQEQISELSKYDPLDLFSKSRERIRKAIKALYSTPQNNFRVFLNGSLIYGNQGGGTKDTTLVTSEAFEDVLETAIQADKGTRLTNFMQLVADTVYTSGVLDRLLEVQKLDSLDIEGTIHVYYNVMSQPCKVCRELDENGVSNRFTSLHSISLDESLKIVKDFLIAATTKDCSIMISFRPREGENDHSSLHSINLESTYQTFDYKVHFIDFDLKPLAKMEDYYELDQKIVDCYAQMMNEENGADKTLTSNHGSLFR